jgi:hypothetical protein
MAEIEQENAAAVLPKRLDVAAVLVENGVKPDLAAMYADAFCEWHEALENINRNGSVVANPRTGAPIDNPYLRVRDKAFDRLRKMRNVNSRCIWDGDQKQNQ